MEGITQEQVQAYMDGLLTHAQAAVVLGRSTGRVSELIRDGKLTGVRTPYGLLIDPASVEAYKAHMVEYHAKVEGQKAKKAEAKATSALAVVEEPAAEVEAPAKKPAAKKV